ncbi:hypothetical protein [Neptunomonas sp.]|uniref:hypothetical protein n=1 Tax=Neptunomonas TaxID=75687 RepID=UPI003514E5A9
MIRKYLYLVMLSALSINCFASDVAPDAYDVLLKNKDEITEHDGCNYPNSGLTKESTNLGNIFQSIFDSMMVESTDLLVLKSCSSQGEYGWRCAITFNDYFRDIKEQGPSPYSMVFLVDESLNLDHELTVFCH